MPISYVRRASSLLLALALGTPIALAAAPAQPPAAVPESAPAAAAQPGSPASKAFTEALAALSADEATYFQHNATLANPFFEGRAPGLRGNVLAAEYVEFHFKRAGLEPFFPIPAPEGEQASAHASGFTFRQTFSAGSERAAGKQSVSVAAIAGPAFAPGADFAISPTSGNGRAEGPLAFVGYSIEKGPEDYSTYAGPDGKDTPESDLTGSIAVVLRLEPKTAEGKSKWATSTPWSGNAALAPKIRRAVQRGAVGVIVIYPPGADDPRVETLDELRTQVRGGASVDVPVIQMKPAAAAKLLDAAGGDLDALTRAADAKGGVTKLAGLNIAIEAEIERKPNSTDNVAGIIRGKGALADQYLILGAHYDHVGYGAFGSRDPQGAGKLHPGADDNASGTAGLLLVAEQIARRYKALPDGASARSIVCMAFSGEEGGLIGSNFFVRNAPVSASATYAMLNMDMIGRLREPAGLEVSGVGSAEGFMDLLKPLFDAAPFKVRTLPGGMGPSDHASFYRGGIPVLHFFTGLHREYHMPTDVYTTVNTPGAVRVCRLFADTAMMLATREQPLVYAKATGPSITMETPDPQASGPGAGGVRVRFGIAPGTYADDKPGVPVGDVYEGTSAAEAGIRKDDRLIRWNGEEVKSVEDWMRFLRAAKPGDLVHVVVVRGSEELTLPVTLKARESEER